MKKWTIAAALFLSFGLSAQPLKIFQLTASEDGTLEMDDGTTLPVWGFQESGGGMATYPAPRFIVNEGDSVQVNVNNTGSMAHTFHLHGFGSDTSNNGEPLNPVQVQPGNTGVFSFRATKAGDYFYHCGLVNPVHEQMGMAGILTVMAAGGVKKAYTGGPAYFKDYHWLLGEFDKAWHLNPPITGNLPPFEPDYFLINGKYGDALGNYNTEDVAIFSAIDQLPVFLTLTHEGVGRREAIFPQLVLASVVVRNGVPQMPSIIVDTLELLSGESFGIMLQAISNGEDSIRINYYAPLTGDFWHQNAAAIYFQHHSATSEPKTQHIVQILPNPVIDLLTVQFNNTPPKGKSEVEIFSEAGILVLRRPFFPGQPLPVHELPNGIYFLKIKGENGQEFAASPFIKK